MSDKIYIQKTELKRADAVRINSAEDIPEALRGAISVQKDGVHLECREGAEVAPLGRVIRWEQTEVSENCPHGINTWAISPEGEKSRFVEKDGAFFQKPTPTPAAPIPENGQIPDWLKGAPIEQKRDGTIELTTDWGVSSGKPGEAYFVKYGTKADGTPDANILTKTEKSFDAYSVCTEDGQNLCTLREFDDAFTAAREKDPTATIGQVYDQFCNAAAANIPTAQADAPARGSEFDGMFASDDKSAEDTFGL